jgi:dihydropteroate synthase
MGVLNVTPDSFSDGGRFLEPAAAIEHGLRLAEAGADLIDIGGESTRPGALRPSAEEELGRVLPVLSALRSRTDVALSIDTSSPLLMCAAAAAGADLLNDVRALTREGALEAAAGTGLPVCLMHMQGEPPTMQRDPRYADVVREVREFLMARVEACVAAGIPRDSLILDPGFGFGKTLEHNLALLRGLPALVAAGFPVLAGLSRKSLLRGLLGDAAWRDPARKLGGSLGLALEARRRGARIVRVHDVAETVGLMRILEVLR